MRGKNDCTPHFTLSTKSLRRRQLSKKFQKEGAHSEFQTSMMMLVMVVVMMMFFMMMCYQEDSGGTKLPKFAGPPLVTTNIAVNSYEKSFFWATQFLLYPNTPIPPPIWKKRLLTLAELFNLDPSPEKMMRRTRDCALSKLTKSSTRRNNSDFETSNSHIFLRIYIVPFPLTL